MVVLNGPQDLLNNLDSIPTDVISVNGLTGTRTFVVRIVTPPGVTATPGTVSVTITVVAVPSSSPTPGRAHAHADARAHTLIDAPVARL